MKSQLPPAGRLSAAAFMQADLEEGEIDEELVAPVANIVKSISAPPVLKSILKKTSILIPPVMLTKGVGLFADVVPSKAPSSSTTTNVLLVPETTQLDKPSRTMMPTTPSSTSSSLMTARQDGQVSDSHCMTASRDGEPAGEHVRGQLAWMPSTSFSESEAVATAVPSAYSTVNTSAAAPQRNSSKIKSYGIFVDDEPPPGSIRRSSGRTPSTSGHHVNARHKDESRPTESSPSSSKKHVADADADKATAKINTGRTFSIHHNSVSTAPQNIAESSTVKRPTAFGPFAVDNDNGSSSKKQTITISQPSSKRPSSLAHTTASERATAAAATYTMDKPRVSGQNSGETSTTAAGSVDRPLVSGRKSEESESYSSSGTGANPLPSSKPWRARAYGPFGDHVDNNNNMHGASHGREPGPKSSSEKSEDPRLSLKNPPIVNVMAGDNAEAVAPTANSTGDIPTSSSSTLNVTKTTMKLLGRPGIFKVDIKCVFPKKLTAKVFRSERQANRDILERNAAASDGMTREAIERIMENELICELVTFMTDDDDRFDPQEGVVIDGEHPMRFDKLLEINGESLFGQPIEYLMDQVFSREKKKQFKLGPEWTMSLKLLRLAPVVKTRVRSHTPPSHHPTSTRESHSIRAPLSRGSEMEQYFQEQQSAPVSDAIPKPSPTSQSSVFGVGMPPPSGPSGRITSATIGSYNQGILEKGQTTGDSVGGIDRFKHSLSSNTVGDRLSGIGLSNSHEKSADGIESSLVKQQQQQLVPTDTLLYELKRLFNSYGEASRKEVSAAIKDSLQRRPERSLGCMSKLFKKIIARKDQLACRRFDGLREETELIGFVLQAIFGSDGVTVERHYCYRDVKQAVASLRTSMFPPGSRPSKPKGGSMRGGTGTSHRKALSPSTSEDEEDGHFNSDDDFPRRRVQSGKKEVPSCQPSTKQKSPRPNNPSSLTHGNKRPLEHPADDEESSSLSSDDDEAEQRSEGVLRKPVSRPSYMSFADRVEDLRAYVEKHKELPSQSTSSLYQFVQNQQYNKRDNKLSQKRVAMLQSVPYFTWMTGGQKDCPEGERMETEHERANELEADCKGGENKQSVKKEPVSFADRVAELTAYALTYNRLPPKSETTLYNFVMKKRREKKAGTLILERMMMLESVPYFTWSSIRPRDSDQAEEARENNDGTIDDDFKQSAKTTFTDRVAELQAYTSMHKKLPPISEPSLYRFYKRQQYNKRDNTLSDERIAMMENVPYFTWIEAADDAPSTSTSNASMYKHEPKGMTSSGDSDDEEEAENFDDLVRKVKKFVKAYDGEFPTAMGFRPCERQLWQFLKNQRELRRSGLLHSQRVKIMEGIDSFTWEGNDDGGTLSSSTKPPESPLAPQCLPDTFRSPSPSSSKKSPRESSSFCSECSYEINNDGDLVRRVSSRARSSVLESSSSSDLKRSRGEDTSVESVLSAKKANNRRDGRSTANPGDVLSRLTGVEVGAAATSSPPRDLYMDVDDDEEEDKNLVVVRRKREADRLAAEQAASALLRRRLFKDCKVWARQSANCVQFYSGTIKEIAEEKSCVCIRWDSGAFDWLQIHPTLIQLNDDVSATSRRTRKL